MGILFGKAQFPEFLLCDATFVGVLAHASRQAHTIAWASEIL